MVAPRLPLQFLASFGSAGPEGNALGSAEMTSRLCNRGAKETRGENGDMVGHTGSMPAAIKACEAVDVCVKEIIETALANQYTTIVIADHGNCETMINPDGSPNTAHTTNPVPVILVDNDKIHIQSGVLGDVAPTILDLMGISQPEAMTQHSLLLK